MDIEKIKDRIAKLLRLAADSSSPNEAAIAASRARKLMDQHQLSEFDINTGTIKEDFEARNWGRSYAQVPKYMSTLAVAIAKYNDVQARLETDPNTRSRTNLRRKFITFCGFKSDVTLAEEMMSRLMDFVVAACDRYLQEKGHTGTYPRDIGDAFKTGMCIELIARIKELTAEREALFDEGAINPESGEITNAGTGLMVLKKEMVAEKFGAVKYVNTRYVGARDDATHDAHHRGRAEGRKVEINRRLEGE